MHGRQGLLSCLFCQPSYSLSLSHRLILSCQDRLPRYALSRSSLGASRHCADQLAETLATMPTDVALSSCVLVHACTDETKVICASVLSPVSMRAWSSTEPCLQRSRVRQVKKHYCKPCARAHCHSIASLAAWTTSSASASVQGYSRRHPPESASYHDMRSNFSPPPPFVDGPWNAALTETPAQGILCPCSYQSK